MKCINCWKRWKRTCHCKCSSKEFKRLIRFIVAPGNAGIAEYAECVNIGAMEFDKLVSFAKEKGN